MENEHDLEHQVWGAQQAPSTAKQPQDRPPSSLQSTAGHEAAPPGPGSSGVGGSPKALAGREAKGWGRAGRGTGSTPPIRAV